MRRRTLITTVGAILGTSVGAAAYSQATTTRNTTFSVAADSSATALIGLAAGTSPQITDNGDKLDVSLENLNTDSTFVFGNPSDTPPLDLSDTSGDYAFSITNNDTIAHDITVGYDTTGATFDIYEIGTDWSDATSAGTVDSATDATLTATAGKEYRVVMTVETTGIGSTSTALDGTLTFTSN